MQADLFKQAANTEPQLHTLADGAYLLAGFALPRQAELMATLEQVLVRSPLRHMHTPGGLRMSVAMTNCGSYGWISDHKGYRYSRQDPLSGKDWPDMPAAFAELATAAAAQAGFGDFVADACLINRYAPATRLSLHQDKDEQDFSAPIVSVSLGLPAVFLLGGLLRTDKPARIALEHGDVMVWGGPSRLRYHGVLPLKVGVHPRLGACRINLTFRKAS